MPTEPEPHDHSSDRDADNCVICFPIVRRITVLCNDALFTLLEPVEQSDPIDDYYDARVAVFDERALDAISEARIEAAGAWWRRAEGALIDVPYRPIVAARSGLAAYIHEVTGLSTEKNVAACIGEMARNSPLSTVDMVNRIVRGRARRLPDAAGAGLTST